MGNSPSSPNRERSGLESSGEANYTPNFSNQAHDFYSGNVMPPRYKILEKGKILKRYSSNDSSSNSTVPTLFRWRKSGNEVKLMGSFDQWTNMIPLVYCEDEFLAVLDLPVGDHQYKFLVDGNWDYDPDEPKIDNGMQSFNNIISIKSSDFEIFKALEADDKTKKKPFSQDESGFGQELPKILNAHHRPPLIPPQLLQIVLNKEDQFSRSDPTLLPVPQHSELNHLHALSIKGGVITMSSTQRYKKKYITTLFYQPTN